MKEFWNERYAQEEFIYGTAPNEFLRETLAHINYLGIKQIIYIV